MKLGHSRKLLTILSTILEPGAAHDKEEEDEGEGRVGVDSITAQRELLDPYVAKWTEDETDKVCAYLLDWNTNARHTFTCQCLLASLIRIRGAHVLDKTPALRDGCSALSAYGERHFLRLNKLHQASFVLDYMVSQMTMLPSEGPQSDEQREKEIAKNAFLKRAVEQEKEEERKEAKRSKKKAKEEVDELVLFGKEADTSSDESSVDEGAAEMKVNEEEEEEEKPQRRSRVSKGGPASSKAAKGSKRKPESAPPASRRKTRRK